MEAGEVVEEAKVHSNSAVEVQVHHQTVPEVSTEGYAEVLEEELEDDC